MLEVPFISEGVYDTTIIVKGLVPPRRKKKDILYEQQLNVHLLCYELLERVEQGKARLFIPSIALVETAAVISCLTNQPTVAEEAVTFLRSTAKKILYDSLLLEEAIRIGIETKASGFDVVFMACSKLLNVPLITDDERLATICKQHNYNCIYVRDLLP